MQPRLKDDLKALAALVVLLTVTHVAHLQASRAFSQVGWESQEVPVFYLPTGQAIRGLSLGQRTTAADLYFLKLVQYVGTPAAELAGWPQLFELANLVTDIDPEYGYAYEVAGLLLSARKRFDESNKIYAKGMEAVPRRWQLPFFAAYNYWYELQDVKTGAQLLWRAAALPGAPAYASEVAAKLDAHANALDVALDYVNRVLASNPSEMVRERMTRRRLEILAEMDLRNLENAIAAFEARHFRKPESLSALIPEFLRFVPKAPDGSEYAYDWATGDVRSSLLPKRLKYTRPPGL